MDEHDEKTIAHMNMVQGVVARLETNCFTMKTMAMTLGAAFLAFMGAINSPNWIYPIAAILPICVFWVMDAQYLRLGRCFRALFNDVRKHKCSEPFSMDIRKFIKDEESVLRIMFSWSVLLFYGSILAAFALSIIMVLSTKSFPNELDVPIMGKINQSAPTVVKEK